MKCVVGVTILFLISLIHSTRAFEWLKLPSLCKDGKEFKPCGDHCADNCQTARQKGPRMFDETADSDSDPMVRDQKMKVGEEKVEPKDKKHGDNRGLSCMICIPGCRCKKGLIEDVISGRCVDPTQCPY